MTSDAVGGVFTYSASLSEAAVSLGARITLAILGPGPSDAQRARLGRIGGLELIETGLPLDWLAEGPSDVRAAADALAVLAHASRSDVAHLHAPALALSHAPWTSPIVSVAHSCVGTWWTAVRGGPPPDDLTWMSELASEGYLSSDVVISPTHAFAKATSSFHRIQEPVVCRNGSDWPILSNPNRCSELVLTSGRLWDEGKGAQTLDAAASLGIEIHAAGPLTSPSGEVAHFPHLVCLGELASTSLAHWLERSGIFVSAAVYEPFGLGVLEAARSGCALVLSDTPTFRELWDGAAEFVPANDSQGFAEAIAALIAFPDRRRELAVAAQARARCYGSSRMAREVMRVWSALIGRERDAVA